MKLDQNSISSNLQYQSIKSSTCRQRMRLMKFIKYFPDHYRTSTAVRRDDILRLI